MTRRLAVAALGLVALHAAALELAARTDLVSALLSPGGHSRLVALGFGASFLALRLVCLIALPAVVPGVLVYALIARTRPPSGRDSSIIRP